MNLTRSASFWMCGAVLAGSTLARLRHDQRELAKARYTATHDELTGLANRPALMNLLEGTAPRNAPTCVAVLDLNGFKQINDTFGHAAGDEVLRAVAVRLRGIGAPVRAVSRLHGDEFAFLIEGGLAESLATASTVADVLANPVPIGARHVSVSASIGVVRIRRGLDPHALIHLADTAMYQAKSGRTNVRAHATH